MMILNSRFSDLVSGTKRSQIETVSSVLLVGCLLHLHNGKFSFDDVDYTILSIDNSIFNYVQRFIHKK
jgi:hypothetical protein